MSELRGMLAETAGRLFRDQVGPDVLYAAESGTWPAALWDALERNGLTRALAGEGQGGVGASWADVFVLLHAAGRSVAPIPLAETVAAGWLLGGVGLDVPDGPLTLVHDPLEGSPRITGRATRVPWGARASHAVAVAGDHLVLLEVAQAAIEAGTNLAGEPRDTLVFVDATPVALAPCGDWPADIVRRCGALVRAVQMAGALEGLVTATVQYANERVQFGRPIGKFQAIQHQLAVLAEHAAAATVAAEVACRAFDAGRWGLALAAAKVRAGDATDAATAIAHQVHGAIGFTHEHALHFTTRRLWAWRTEFGSTTQWARELGRLTLAGGPDALWPTIVAG